MRERRILHVDLSRRALDTETREDAFFRTYLGGGAIGTYYLLRETDPGTDPLSPENVLTLAPGPATGAAVSGVSRCSITALSPETGAVGDSQAGGSFGPFLRRTGFDVVVIRGRADRPCYLYLHDGTGEIRDAEDLRGKTVLEAHDILTERHSDGKVSIVQCGPAGEKLVRFASLASDLNNIYGRTGMGAVFGSKNLRALVVSGSGKVEFADPDGLRRLGKKGVDRVMKEGVGETLRKFGTPGLVGGNALSGNLCIHNYSSGYDDHYEQLDGPTYDSRIGSKGSTCFACAIGCRKTIKTEEPYRVTDRLGGPEFETLGVLGSNLDIFDPVAVARANELCNNYGIDTITMGGLASYLCESLEKGALTAEQVAIDDFGFGRPEGIFTLIEKTVRREGIGGVIAEGFASAVSHLGADSAQYAVHTKGHGFAVHMPQVKPSMALLYSVSPIGADHMSSEHDWIAADESEAARGLGLYYPGELNSYGTDKVRAVTYSQLFYALLDSLGLCMFVWGPGSVYNYKDLEELVRAATGWEVSLWELMKSGERRINMMRLINLRRGFTAGDDELPEKMFIPLKGGPSDGRAVDREGFRQMCAAYYALMGWDENGVPTRGKLIDLDLEWAVKME
jgi:aldehyde:ferredoxin oxidoreductase